MYDKATTGTKRNNRFFSKCSIDSMVPVISKFGYLLFLKQNTITNRESDAKR